jgi:hypothetical protein
MMVYSKQSYDGMFPDPIAFINDELKAELGMKRRKTKKNTMRSYVLSRYQWIIKTMIPRHMWSRSSIMTQGRHNNS